MPYVGDLPHEKLHDLRIQRVALRDRRPGARIPSGLLADQQKVRDEARAMLVTMDSDIVRRRFMTLFLS